MSDVSSDCPSEWTLRSLEQISSQITSGGTPTSGDPRYYVESGGLPFAKTEDLTRARTKFIDDCDLEISDAALKESSAKRYPAGTIFISMYGTIELTKIASVQMAANQALCALIPPFSCDADYLYHHLDYIRPKWLKHSGQTTQANINGAAVRAHVVPAPGLDEQRKVAGILDTLDAAIHETQAIIAKLKAVKQGLLHDLLTRGIDSNGELRPPQSEAPHLYKPSPLGWIPKEWDACELNNLVDPARPVVYGILMPGYGCPGGVPVVKVKDISADGIGLDGLLLTSPQIDREYSRSRLRAGDLLFTIRGTVGRMAIVPDQLDGANITQDTARLSIKFTDARFVRACLAVGISARFIAVNTLGVAVQGINLRDVRRIPLPRPKDDEAIEIGCRLDSANQRVKDEVLELEKLKLVKAGLMDDLLTGRVRVTPLLEGATP